MCKRGDIYLVDFGYANGTFKERGVRPAVVVSNDKANAFSPVITVVPLTSRVGKKPGQPTHVFLEAVCSGLKMDSMALAEQVGAIDKAQMVRKVGALPDMEKIEKALQVQMGLVL